MPFDAGPGELDQAGAAIAVAEDPVVVPELAGLAEVPAGDPAFRLVRVAPCGPLAGEFPHVVVQGGERPGRHHCPVIGRPAPDDGVKRGNDRYRVAAAQAAHLGREPFPEPPDGRLGRLDQQLAAGVAADAEPGKVEALTEVDDLRLVLSEGQPPGRQPLRYLRLDVTV